MRPWIQILIIVQLFMMGLASANSIGEKNSVISFQIPIEGEVLNFTELNISSLIKKFYPNLQKRNLQILSIKLLKKSGHGEAVVILNDRSSSSAIVNDFLTYLNLNKENQGMDYFRDTNIKLELWGSLKLSQIVVSAKSDSPPDNGGFGGEPPKVEN